MAFLCLTDSTKLMNLLMSQLAPCNLLQQDPPPPAPPPPPTRTHTYTNKK